jgi:hypothetical protein
LNGEKNGKREGQQSGPAQRVVEFHARLLGQAE